MSFFIDMTMKLSAASFLLLVFACSANKGEVEKDAGAASLETHNSTKKESSDQVAYTDRGFVLEEEVTLALFVDTTFDLPECNRNILGNTAYIHSDQSIRRCSLDAKSGFYYYKVTDLEEEASDNKQACALEGDESSFYLNCANNKTIDLSKSDADLAGTGCEKKSVEGGKYVICGSHDPVFIPSDEASSEFGEYGYTSYKTIVNLSEKSPQCRSGGAKIVRFLDFQPANGKYDAGEEFGDPVVFCRG